MAPTWNPEQKGVKVQIIDVFALELATGYDKDPEGRFLLSSEPYVSAGRTWSLAKACQLVRNDDKAASAFSLDLTGKIVSALDCGIEDLLEAVEMT